MKLGFKLCPHCGEEIRKQAIKCQYCHKFINEKVEKQKEESQKTYKKKMGVFGRLLCVLYFLITIPIVAFIICFTINPNGSFLFPTNGLYNYYYIILKCILIIFVYLLITDGLKRLLSYISCGEFIGIFNLKNIFSKYRFLFVILCCIVLLLSLLGHKEDRLNRGGLAAYIDAYNSYIDGQQLTLDYVLNNDIYQKQFKGTNTDNLQLFLDDINKVALEDKFDTSLGLCVMYKHRNNIGFSKIKIPRKQCEEILFNIENNVDFFCEKKMIDKGLYVNIPGASIAFYSPIRGKCMAAYTNPESWWTFWIQEMDGISDYSNYFWNYEGENYCYSPFLGMNLSCSEYDRQGIEDIWREEIEYLKGNIGKEDMQIFK